MAAGNFVNEEDRNRISETVARMEKLTIGEIVPMIVSSSDRYPAARLRFAILFAFLALSVVSLFFSKGPIWFIGTLFVAGLVIGYGLGEFTRFKQMMLCKREVEEETFQRAVEEFHLHKISHTQSRTGILIFVSLLERRVILLADEGINQSVEEGTWQTIVDAFVQAIKMGQVADGFMHAIESVGAVLSEKLPIQGESPNQLPNHLIVK